MAEKLTVPRMGEGVEEVTIVRWLKEEGDTVSVDEPVVEVETDKVSMELPSPFAGTLLKIAGQASQVLPVGEVLAWIGQPGEALAPAPAVAAAAEPAAPPIPPGGGKKLAAPASAPLETTPGGYRGFVSPLVRKLVDENKIDLDLIKGTGEGGRITKQDVLAYLQTMPPARTAATSMPSAGTKTPSPAAAGAAGRAPMEGRLIPHSPIRRQIAERMVNSVRAAPHVLSVMEADMSRVLAHQAASREEFSADGVKLTLTAYFIAAIVAGLTACPEANASWTDEGLLVHPNLNIGMAVALGNNGLIVPVIRRAEELALLGIARQVADLAERARSKKLLPEEVRDGTFSLTNHGTGGSLFALPIINQPQVGILGTGRVQKRPVVVPDASGSDAIAIRPMVYLSFVFDHRVLDGEGADQFLAKVKETLEDWE